MSALNCAQCSRPISSEDAIYDDRQAHYYCRDDCFRDWADEHFDEVTEFYARLNLN